MLGEVFADGFFFLSDMHITLVTYPLLHMHGVTIWTKQTPRSLLRLVHPHVSGKRAAFAWGRGVSVGIGECLLIHLDRHFYDLPIL